DEVQTMEVFWDQQPEAPKWFEIWQRPLINKKGLLLGRLITLSDITSRKKDEEALSNERILLRTLIDNLPVSVYVKDTQGRKTLANKADLQYMGLKHESEALGKTDLELFPPELASRLYANDQKVLQSGQPLLDQEELLPGIEEKERWVLTSKVPFLDNQGKMLGILGIGRDISDWKKMQKELENSEARFRTLTESTSAAVFIYQGPQFIYLNPASEKLTGYTAEELKQMNFWDVIHPDSRQLVKNRGLNRQMGLPESSHYEFKIITKEGHEKWVDYSTGITMYQGEVAAIGTCFDITKRKIAEEALARSEQRYRKIFENSNTGILQLSPQGQVINANNAFAQIFGYESALNLLNEKAGIYQRIFSRQEDQLYFFKEIEQKESVHNFSFEAHKINGEKIWVMVNAWKSQAGGPLDYLIEGFFQDITDRKLSLEYQNEVEVARKSSETKNQFLANMSHEIRTPVNGIMGMADVLSHTSLSSQQKEYLKTIEESSQVLLNIINDILDISKIEAGKMQLRPEAFNLPSMMDHLNKMFYPIARNNNLLLQFNLGHDIPEWVHGDKKRIEQILLNLISNALKFTNQGTVLVSLSSNALDSSGHLIRFEVKDSGMGINPDDQARLFQKFSQLDNSLTRGTSGTGLGLFICRELVKLMNGEIAVTSTPAKGSTFWFSIPLQTAVEPAKKMEGLSARTVKASAGLSVLVVDDKLVNQKVLSLMLQGEGCEVEIACNGQEALTKFVPEKHQMVFMDIMMPVMDGVTAMKTLHQKHVSLPPIIALTANAMEGDAQHYLNSGFNDYLAKPVSRKDLQLMLDKWTVVSG
ncbi:MAG: PAS domain S-box protein, partial [Bacteroidales bacterium]